MTISKNLERRLEDIELQVESLMEQQIRTDRLLTRIEGGLTAMKWLGAILGVIFTIWEII
jgi:chaperonin cofactor prefoldin